MSSGNGKAIEASRPRRDIEQEMLHPAWEIFLRYCRELRHGEIERLKIQDGLPVLAEVTTKKIKFAP